MKRIVLIGFMGTGKTAVGRRLAERLGWRFLDIDALIEERLGMSIGEIFERYGEVHFRKVEKEIVADVWEGEGLVVATGGGVVLDTESVFHLKNVGRIIHLSARPDIILNRTKGDHDRPLLATEDREKRVASLLARRASFYAGADHQIDTSELSIEDVVEEILHYLQELSHG
jgi:shikimate kinase